MKNAHAEIVQELDELETRTERLRALYEQYFSGIERLEPLIQRKDVDRRIWLLRKRPFQNTALRFRFQTIVQRYNTYQQYWGRIVREIESGTYRRDVVRAAKRIGEKEALTLVSKKRAAQYALLAKRQEGTAGKITEDDTVWNEIVPYSGEPPDTIADTDTTMPFADIPTLIQSAPPTILDSMRTKILAPPRGMQPKRHFGIANLEEETQRKLPEPKPPSVSKTELSDRRIRSIYEKYVELRRSNQESTVGITLEKLSSKLRKEIMRLRQEHPERRIDFEVKSKNGKTVIKPVVR